MSPWLAGCPVHVASPQSLFLSPEWGFYIRDYDLHVCLDENLVSPGLYFAGVAATGPLPAVEHLVSGVMKKVPAEMFA